MRDLDLYGFQFLLTLPPEYVPKRCSNCTDITGGMDAFEDKTNDDPVQKVRLHCPAALELFEVTGAAVVRRSAGLHNPARLSRRSACEEQPVGLVLWKKPRMAQKYACDRRGPVTSINPSLEPEPKIVIVGGKTPPEDRTLREIFDTNKSDATEIAARLANLIPDIGLDDGLFDNEEAGYGNRPMRTLLLAQQLCDTLEIIECLKLI